MQQKPGILNVNELISKGFSRPNSGGETDSVGKKGIKIENQKNNRGTPSKRAVWMAHPVKRNKYGAINVQDLGQKLQKQVYDKIAEVFNPEQLFGQQTTNQKTAQEDKKEEAKKNIAIQISRTENNTPLDIQPKS